MKSFMSSFMIGLMVSQISLAQTVPNNKAKAAGVASLVAAAVTVKQLKSDEIGRAHV